jgi:hypothetical protein
MGKLFIFLAVLVTCAFLVGCKEDKPGTGKTEAQRPVFAVGR